jgi:uroporphyrinogen-III synthase
VLVTSGNALAALPAALHGTLLLAVGDATAARARTAGFTEVHSAGRDATALAELAAAMCAPRDGPLLLASGAGNGLDLAAALRARGFRVLRRVAYAARPVAALPEPARIALAGGTLRAALFFSPATARVFMTILQRDMPADSVREIDALAISRATEQVLKPLPWRRLRVASHPTQDELLTLLP